jgi:multidrug efflux pump
MLTLYTTPVVYLALDRLRLRVMGKQRDTFHPDEGAIPATGD